MVDGIQVVLLIRWNLCIKYDNSLQFVLCSSNPCDPLVIVQFLIDSKDSPRVTECIWTLERGTRTESVLLCLIDTWPLGLNLPSFFLWVPVYSFLEILLVFSSCGPSFFLLVPVCSFSGNLVGPLIDDLPLALGCLKIVPAKNCTLH